MKKAIKQTFAIICAIIMVFACNFSALAISKIDSDDDLQIRYKQLTQYVEDFLDLEEGKLSQPYELYDINDEVNALLFTIKDGGYIIINIDNYDVPEYSLESNTYYKLDGRRLYYDGPLNYYQQVSNNEIENALTKSVVPKSVLESTEWYGITSSYIETKAVTRVARVTQTISGILPNYSYNPDGRCGAVAASMWLRYYNNYYDTRYVPSDLETSDGKKLIIYMTDLIPLHAIPGTVLSGLREHLDEQGLNGADISMNNPSMALVASYVTSDKPFILGVRGHAELGDHYVTGYGYESAGGSNYAIVNDGHGESGVRINMNSSGMQQMIG